MIKNKIQYVLLMLAIIIAMCLTFYKNLSYNYEMQGNIIDITGLIIQSEGYEITDNADNTKTFTVISDDPKFIIDLSDITNTQSGGVRLTYTASNTAKVQIFYAKDNESYAEKHSTISELDPDSTEIIIPIKLDTYSTLRIDIDGDFTLSNIYVSEGGTKATAYISDKTLSICLWYFPAIIIGFILIFWAHKTKIKDSGYNVRAYIENVFLGSSPSPKREVYLDYLRVLAAVFVILAHTCSPYVDQTDNSFKRLILIMGLGLGLSCNVIYVMLSGTLLLNSNSKKEESVVSFYLKRASKVIIPLIAYYLLLLSFNNEVSFLPPRNILNAFKRIVTGAPDAAPHLWLIYTIVALYFVTPFFRVMVKYLGDRLIFALWAVIIVLNILTTYLPIFGMTFGATSFLSGWEGVFLLGFILTRQNELEGSHKRNRYMMIAAIISYIISCIVVFKDSTLMNYVYGNTTALIIVSCGIFAFFVEIKDKFVGKSNWIIRLCSKYSYSIILIHWYALFVIVTDKFHIMALRFGCVGGIIATVIATLVCCIIMAIIYDNTVVIVLNTAFDKLCTLITKNKN